MTYNRVQRGVPTGGQFAVTRRVEPDFSLGDEDDNPFGGELPFAAPAVLGGEDDEWFAREPAPSAPSAQGVPSVQGAPGQRVTQRPDGKPLDYVPSSVVEDMREGRDIDCGFHWSDAGRSRLRVSLSAKLGEDHGVLYVHDAEHGQSAVIAEDITLDEVDAAFSGAVRDWTGQTTEQPLSQFTNRLHRSAA